MSEREGQIRGERKRNRKRIKEKEEVENDPRHVNLFSSYYSLQPPLSFPFLALPDSKLNAKARLCPLFLSISIRNFSVLKHWQYTQHPTQISFFLRHKIYSNSVFNLIIPMHHRVETKLISKLIRTGGFCFVDFRNTIKREETPKTDPSSGKLAHSSAIYVN